MNTLKLYYLVFWEFHQEHTNRLIKDLVGVKI